MACDAPVAIVAGKQIMFSALELDVATLSAHLGACQERRWLLLAEDAYAIAVGFLAALYAGKIVVLPANHQLGHVSELSDQVDGILVHEQSVPPDAKVLSIFTRDAARSRSSLEPFDAARAEVIFHTSGTTGEPAPVHKSLTCLEQELVVLEKLFPRAVPCVVLATVPAHHIYGLLFRVLWPLVAGRPFVSELIRYPEEFEREVENADSNLLVSSPAFLARALQILDISALKDRLSGVFSSGGPLPPETAVTYNAQLRAPIIEVYGSTETGGIGHRATLDAAKPEPFTAFPGVTLSVDSDGGNLSVSSPFIDNGRSFRTGDTARILGDGRFELLGRSDRIVKVEERRISLMEVERKLASRAEVSDVHVELLQGSTGRKYLGAVIVPTSEGWTALAGAGKRALTKTLRTALASHMDLAAIPRKWRFVRKLPETIQGKTPIAQLQAMFSIFQDDETRPILLDRGAGPSEIQLKLKLPTELKYFDGHFDGFPILAGVVQLDWAIKFAREAFPVDGIFQRIEALKFFRVLRAGEEVTLELRFDPEKKMLHFQYNSERHAHSAGRIRFAAAS